MSVFLETTGLTKRFGSLEALSGVDIEVNDDELLVVLGPTGAGKTTLLRTLVGLESAEAGEIRVEGEDISKLSPAQRDFSLVFQNFSLYPNWTVYDNMAFSLRAPGRKLPESEIREKIERAADMLHIRKHLDRKATQLSGGEMQRVAIGRCIVRTPRMYLMDEPLTNLDAKLREALRVELVEMRRELGKPMIYVTHDQAEALSMGDRIVVLSEGKVLQVGTPEEVYTQPVSTVVARQLGQPQINLLDVEQKDGAWINSDGASVCRASDNRGEAVLGVRPEHVVIGDGVEGEVVMVEDMGPNLVLVVDWLGYHLHVNAEKGGAVAKPGERIKLRVAEEKVLVFDSPAKG